MKENILLVEDEEALCMALSDRLRKDGYEVDFVTDGEKGFMLPGRNGLDLCRDIRTAGLGTPILLLTARSEIVDKIVGLKLGADDYVTKPFDMQELMARIEALLRRAPIRTGQVVHQFGPIRIETRGMMDHRDVKVTRAGAPIYLSAREFELLRYFVEHPGMVLSREELLRAVWGYEAGTFTRTVDVHVASLRQKIEKDPKRPELIVTVHKSGYRFVGGGEY
ncbi:MAG: DNA-binding response regulator [Acidobacteria bacterium]|nr:MAG: DNA-binding response regulator [Acidobacteriota bacterium]